MNRAKTTSSDPAHTPASSASSSSRPAANGLSTISHRCLAAGKAFAHRLASGLNSAKVAFLTRFARWSDPKLAPYRASTGSTSTKSTHNPNDSVRVKNSSTWTKSSHFDLKEQGTDLHSAGTTSDISSAKTEQAPLDVPVPQTTTEFLDLMRRTPRTVLSQRERHVIATIMSFPETRVSEIMSPQSAITYVQSTEVLGPLTLDRLYRSGFQHFPVLNSDHQIIGVIHTTALNSLEIREASRALDIIDPKIYYLREDYTLNQALAAFLRTNCYFFLVIDRFERIVGILTYETLIDYLLGETPSDNFDRDHDRLAVAKRKL